MNLIPELQDLRTITLCQAVRNPDAQDCKLMTLICSWQITRLQLFRQINQDDL